MKHTHFHKLNVCCGKRILPGYVNVDVAPNKQGEPQPDRLAKADELPFVSGSVGEILCVHGWEHFYRWECDDVIAEWGRVMRSGALLVLELPDLMKCCQNFVNQVSGPKHEDQMHMWGIYGDATLMNPFMIHRWGWTPQTLERFLRANGFGGIRHMPTQFHPVGRQNRDMRIEATRV